MSEQQQPAQGSHPEPGEPGDTMTQAAPPAPSRAAGDYVPSDRLDGDRLPRFTGLATLVVCLAVAAGLTALFGSFNPVGAIVLGVVLFLIVIYLLSRAVERPRKAADRLARYVITLAFIVAIVPLVSLIWQTVASGAARFDLQYFTYSMSGVAGAGGGALHAIMGTLIVTGIATLISVPIGLFTAIYLVEYGKGFMKRGITFLTDVMTGIPSIVAGLFAYAIFSLIIGPGSKSGLAAAVALCVLMIPYVVRNCEEILRLVPNSLREAAYALGTPKWRTIVKVVLPTSISGIVSGIILAIARIIGETAPLLVTASITAAMVYDPLPVGTVNPMTTLPVFVYYQYMQPSPLDPQAYFDRAWTGALVLILLVMLLNLIGRFIAQRFAPKLNR